jgi:DNA gyrase subunit A
MEKGDYLVGMATTPKPNANVGASAPLVQGQDNAKAKVSVAGVAAGDSPADADAIAEVVDVGKKGTLILSVTENGYGKRTPAEEYRLQGRGGSGVINVKTTERNGKVVGISQVEEHSEVMLISQYGKIIRMDSKTIRESGRAAQGVRLLNLEPGDRVAASVVIPPEEEPANGTLIQ